MIVSTREHSENPIKLEATATVQSLCAPYDKKPGGKGRRAILTLIMDLDLGEVIQSGQGTFSKSVIH